MSCSSPTEVSQIYARTARCQRWWARGALLLAVITAWVVARSAMHLVQQNDELEWSSGLIIYLAPILLVITFCVLALRRFRASHHAQAKANQLLALELLLAKAPDEARKQVLAQQIAEVVVGKASCCK